MKAINIKKFGGPEVLEYKEIEIGEPGPKEVLVKNLSIGLNYIDVYHRTGLYPVELPSGLGLEAAGIIEEIGSEVKLFNIGDRVCKASAPIGGYSEKQIVPEEKLVKIPDGISDEIASSILLKGITSEYLLHRAYKVKKGDKILFHAAAGGVGQILCQWAKNIGAYVIGTVSNSHKEKIAKLNGCDFVINYTENEFDEKIIEITEKKGVDVIYDSVGKDTFLKGIKCLAPKGKIVSFGVSSGPIEPININLLRSFSGSIATGGLNTYIKDSDEMQNNADAFFDLILKKEIDIDITNEFNIEEIQKAQLSLESRQTTGSVILKF